MKIALLSDTHSHLDERIVSFLEDQDEIWHAGDIGSLEVLEQLEAIATTRAVYGNIDGHEIRRACPKEQIFEVNGLKVFMIHIGGYPPRYSRGIAERLDFVKPDLFISGHSHILKVIQDQKRELLHMNPGAAGHNGIHKMRTLIRFSVERGRIVAPEVVELGFRGA